MKVERHVNLKKLSQMLLIVELLLCSAIVSGDTDDPSLLTLERIMKEIRRRTRVVGSFPDGQSALMLVAARLRHIASTKWGPRRYMNM
jgi:hypothetical protein